MPIGMCNGNVNAIKVRKICLPVTCNTTIYA